MSERNFKEIRKQLRTVVREIIDEVLTQELAQVAYGQVQENITKRLDMIDTNVKQSLDKIGDSAKEFQGYVMRELAAAREASTPLPPPTEAAAADAPAVSE